MPSSSPPDLGPPEAITDPGALLDAVAPVERESAAPAPATGRDSAAPLVQPAPESAERLVAATTPATVATPSLRAGEEIARASGAGVVIGRRKPEW